MSTYDDASLIYYPSGYKEDKIYSLKPTDGSGDLTFTRASSATRVNSDGLIESPRTNLVLYSEEFDNAYWTKTNVTITANATTAPDGNLTADKLVENSVNGNHFIYRSQATFTASASYFQSWYVKAGERYKVRIQDASDGTFFAAYNLNTGSLIDEGTNTIGNTTITPLLNGWYRLTLLLNQATSAKYAGIILLPDSYTAGDSITYQGNGTSGVYIWGAQIEAGSTATDYIPTTNSARTTFAGITQDGTSASNIPRIDYTGGGCAKLLLEPQRTNVALNSETFGAGTGTTIVLNNTASPDGYVSADKLVEDTSTGVHITTMGASLGGSVDSSIYSVSVFVKAAGRTRIQFFDNNQASGGLSNFDLANGVVISGSGKIENYGNGWYRCIIFPVKDNSTTSNCQIRLISTGTTTSYTGDGTSGVFLWGKQIEDSSSYATSYIPTTSGTAVTRLADAMIVDDVYTNNLVTASGGTWYIEIDNNFAYTRDGSQVGIFIANDTSGGVATDGLALRNNGAAARLIVNKRISGVQTPIYNTTTDHVKVAIKWNGTTADVFENGVKVVNSTAFTPTIMEYFGSFGGDVPKYIVESLLFPTALSDDDLTLLTGTLGETYFQSYALMANYLNYTIQ
jgi:hypothetical protein